MVAMVTENGCHGYAKWLPWLREPVAMVTENGCYGYMEWLLWLQALYSLMCISFSSWMCIGGAKTRNTDLPDPRGQRIHSLMHCAYWHLPIGILEQRDCYHLNSAVTCSPHPTA